MAARTAVDGRTRPGTDASRPATLVLVSGGIESTTLLYAWHAEGRRLNTLFVDYGQRAAHREFAAVRNNDAQLGLTTPRLTLDTQPPPRTDTVPSARRIGHVPLPHRNLLLIAVAANHATERQAQTVALGVTRDDATHAEAGTTASFLTDLQSALRHLAPLTLEAPFRDWTKPEVVALGRRLGVDYEANTYSCLLGRSPPCGGCPQCLNRARALGAADFRS